jgi:hypothetical protein
MYLIYLIAQSFTAANATGENGWMEISYYGYMRWVNDRDIASDRHAENLSSISRG